MIILLQKGFSYLMHTREEKLFVSMQQRLQQAAINDRERRTLLAQLESREEAQKVLVCESLLIYMDTQHLDYMFTERHFCHSFCSWWDPSANCPGICFVLSTMFKLYMSLLL